MPHHPRPNREGPTNQLKALLALEQGLSAWEVEFIESLGKKLDKYKRLAGHISDRQRYKLEELYNKHIVEESNLPHGSYRKDDTITDFSDDE